MSLSHVCYITQGQEKSTSERVTGISCKLRAPFKSTQFDLLSLVFKSKLGLAAVMHALDPSSWEAEAGVSLRPACSTR